MLVTIAIVVDIAASQAGQCRLAELHRVGLLLRWWLILVGGCRALDFIDLIRVRRGRNMHVIIVPSLSLSTPSRRTLDFLLCPCAAQIERDD